MGIEEVDQLVRKVTGVAIGDGTDCPSCFEGSDGRDGMLTIREHLVDEDGIFIGDFEVSEGTLLDVIQGAQAEGGNFGSIDIAGLTAVEAAQVLSDSRYIEGASEIAGVDGGLKINGADYELRGEGFVEYDS